MYENLPPGGALRTSYEIGRELIQRGHQLDLFRLSTYADKGPFDLAPHAHAVDVTKYRPLAGTLDARLRAGHLAPRSYTLFGPLKRVHRQLATRIISGRYDVVFLHPDAMTDAPYVLRWLDAVPTVYYCQEPLRFTSERAVLDQHRRVRCRVLKLQRLHEVFDVERAAWAALEILRGRSLFQPQPRANDLVAIVVPRRSRGD